MMARPPPARVIAAVLLIWALLLICGLNLPLVPGALLRLPVELPLILLLLSLPFGRARLLRLGLVLAIMLGLMVKAADLAMRMVLDRGFTLAGDLPLVGNFADLLADSFGPLAFGAALFLLTALAGAIALGLWKALEICAISSTGPRIGVTACLLVLALVGSPAASRFMLDQGAEARQGLADLRRFRQVATQDRWTGHPPDLRLIDRDVMVVFLESYGRTSFDTDFYAQEHLPILRQAEARLGAAGLAMRSGFLTSPTHGGQSWLAHATFANGIRVEDQGRYRALLASGRQSLFHLARAAGFRTATVAPAITRPWPEAGRMGFDRVLAADDLGYRGKPFNWVTMPDQFTLAAADRLLGGPGRGFAQVVLISSHAPWVPVPRMIGWDELGDGRIFDAMALAGDTPEVVWRDKARVRAQYRAAISYSLQAVLDHATRHAEDPPLLILLGDHQAATTIGDDPRREVPVHVIGPEALVARTAGWGLTPGLIPPPGSPAIPMESLRDLFLLSFSTQTDPPA